MSGEAGWDEWVRLWATRDELAEWYADQLCEYGTNAPGWRQINEAIVRRWSKSALVYIKTKAWKIAQSRPPAVPVEPGEQHEPRQGENG